MIAVRCVELCKTYVQGDTRVKALDHLSIEIETGGFVCLSSPSGGGKTTLLNAIGGLDIGERTQPVFRQRHPPAAAGRDDLVVEIIRRVVHRGGVTIADQDVGTRAFLEHEGKVVPAEIVARLGAAAGYRLRRAARHLGLLRGVHHHGVLAAILKVTRPAPARIADPAVTAAAPVLLP